MTAYLPFIVYVYCFIAALVYSRTDIGTALAWPVVGAIKAVRAIFNAARVA